MKGRVGMYGLLVVIGLTCQPAQGGDRRSVRRDQISAEEILVARPETVVAARSELPGAGTTRASQSGPSSGPGLRLGRPTGTPTKDAWVRQRQRVTLFRIDSDFGGVAVEPVIGKVNGVQFSLGF